MSEFVRVTDDFYVAHQLEKGDIKRAAEEGFTRIIGNRPDGEQAGAMTIRDAEQEAAESHIDYYALPFAGPPPANVVEATVALFDEGEAKTLAYCRSGTRSITTWAMAEVKAGKRTPDEVIDLARDAGYDLAAQRPALERLAAG